MAYSHSDQGDFCNKENRHLADCQAAVLLTGVFKSRRNQRPYKLR